MALSLLRCTMGMQICQFSKSLPLNRAVKPLGGVLRGASGLSSGRGAAVAKAARPASRARERVRMAGGPPWVGGDVVRPGAAVSARGGQGGAAEDCNHLPAAPGEDALNVGADDPPVRQRL